MAPALALPLVPVSATVPPPTSLDYRGVTIFTACSPVPPRTPSTCYRSGNNQGTSNTLTIMTTTVNGTPTLTKLPNE